MADVIHNHHILSGHYIKEGPDSQYSAQKCKIRAMGVHQIKTTVLANGKIAVELGINQTNLIVNPGDEFRNVLDLAHQVQTEIERQAPTQPQKGGGSEHRNG